jgi:light-independent protochlorophyllide reductase subunit B
VEEAVQKQTATPAEPIWTPEAEARIERIPAFVRPMVKKGVEQHAREKGYAEITADVMSEARGVFGM